MTINYGGQRIPVYADPTATDNKLFKLINSLQNDYNSYDEAVEDLMGMLNAIETTFEVNEVNDGNKEN